MSRARIRKYKDINKDKLKEIISNIEIEELKEIAELYYVKECSELDISFELDYSERTIRYRISEINKIIEGSI